MKIDILGTEYELTKKNACDDVLLDTRTGYCDRTTKSIVVGKLRPEPGSNVDVSREEKCVLRHEIIHAFLYESGLGDNSDWGTDETLVDWIAIQFPKMARAFDEAECIWEKDDTK